MSKRRRAKSSTVRSRPGPARTGNALFGLICVCALALGAFLGSSSSAMAAEACPNETLRAENNSLALPSCRAYEQVSAVDKENYNAQEGVLTADGEHVTYFGRGAFAGAPLGGGSRYVATRSPGGWQTQSASYPLDPSTPSMAVPAVLEANADASQILSFTAAPLDPDDLIANSNDYYLRAADGSLTWLSRRPAGFAMPPGVPYSFWSAATTTDLGHVVWNTDAKLVPAAAGLTDSGYGLYDWTDGAAHLVNVDSSGALVSTYGAGFGGGLLGKQDNALSQDGERIFFTTPQAVSAPPPGPESIKRIYLRQSGRTTTEISASQCTIPACEGPEQDAMYQGAAADGSVAFFTSSALLTNDATTGGGLYRYDVASGMLTLITRDAADSGGAQVEGEVLNSDDGKLVYLVAKGVLAPGATAGANNLYLYDATTAQTTFIVALSNSDATLWTGGYGSRAAEVTPSGRQLIFQSVAPLTPGYDNAGHSEVYRYEVGAPAPVCLSCLPAGVPASGNSTFTTAGGSLVHNISDDGSRVFFQSSGALVPRDVNGKIDVYEWHDGAVSLLTPGTGPKDAAFNGASASGRDVLVTTDDALAPADRDELKDVYDVRIDGGFPAPPAIPVGCVGVACRNAADGVPSSAGLGSMTFFGRGNPAGAEKQNRCQKQTRSAKKLKQRAKRARNQARMAKNAKQAQRLRQKAKRLNDKAARSMKGCRKTTKAAEGHARAANHDRRGNR